MTDQSPPCSSHPAAQHAHLLKTAQDLASHIAKRCYPEVTQWQVLDDLAGVISQIGELESQLSKWETTLTAVMPADFKDWHQNSKAEWPEIAALVITNLREHIDEDAAYVARLEEQVAALTLENENVKRANLDCVDHFNALKVDYDEAAKQVAVLRKALNGFIANSCRVDWPADIYDAAIAAQKGTP